MAGVNKVIVMGHLRQDPEMRYTQSNDAVATLSIATSEQFKDKEGNKQERTEWHRVVLWRRLAEIAGEYLRKGSMAYVEGRLQTRKWTDKEGVERYTTEIVGDRLQLVGGKSENGGGNGGNNRQRPAQSQSASQRQAPNNGSGSRSDPFPEDFDDDIPF
ncbi:single-stranded DNA-binding protein [Acidithiobacillus ferridurans]|uniref:Single-stranded DNA-binding protein n=1 Tax=Acidithiobacillus ferridurans TaxID=1232575 RepID=A0A8X8KC56_ACIFI|nr:single-stranded DNA-binding protein [Acidithiobacillus ferridurans]MBU2715105.1 single-stranded DNA-binding protein [Acidithiobacillus ferridurans]MBU2723902.1 single-stranded DNA-binding protein [Acidithiobacillus ferridurans]MBU2727953.1 single-stranded DNA-binding protein [Acidithiobacillus ferridurans]